MVALIGSYGFNWVLLAILASFAALAQAPRSRGSQLAGGLALASCGLIYLHGALALAKPSGATDVQVRIVQPNTPQLAEYDEATGRRIAADYLRATVQRPRPAGPLVIVWPEGALPDPALVSPSDDLPPASQGFLTPGQPIRAAIEQALRPGDLLLMGAVRADRSPPSVRYFNSLMAIVRTPVGLQITGEVSVSQNEAGKDEAMRALGDG
ncbi:MAG: hypothetical protein EOO60_05155, partial [Hymenobacter sp.]